MIPTAPSFNIIWVIFGLVASFIVFFVIQPLVKMYPYKKEGVETYFFPIIGIFRYWDEVFTKRGDAMILSKESSKKLTNPKYMVSNIMRKPVIIPRDPQYTKEFLLKPHLYKKSDAFETLTYLGKRGIAWTEGDIWKRNRRVLSSAFHYEFLKENAHVFQDTARKFFDKLTASDLARYPVIGKIQEITAEVVGRIFFGENLHEYSLEGKPVTLALADITSELSLVSRTPLVSIFGPKTLKIPFVARYKSILSRVTGFRNLGNRMVLERKAQRLEGKRTKDLLDALLDTQDSEDPDKRFTDDEIIDQFVTFFIAGMDTTAHMVGMALYSLTQHPEYLQELKEERDRTYNKEAKVTADTLQNMNVLHSFLKETLRFYTPAPVIFPREVVTDHKLCDLNLKKGDIIMPEFLAPAFDEKYFDEPFKFNPARWRDSSQERDPYAFIPFSAGPRNCIGQHLAMMEGKAIMSEFLERYEFKIKEDYKLRMIIRFTYEAEEEIVFSLRPKDNKHA